MQRPLIGITTYREASSWGDWRNVPAAVLPAAYHDAVSAAGGTPVLLPPYGPGDDVPGLVGRLDGLVLAGGSDINPSRYAEAPHPATSGWRDDRDVSEMALLYAAGDRDLPVLGICRGLQLMAVVNGGTLHQHVPDVVGHTQHSPGPRVYGAVEVTCTPGSRVAALIGDRATVSTHHHQAVRTHPGLVPTAVDQYGIVQALEDPRRRFWLGVHWHPEVGTDLRLFRALVEASGSHPTAG